MNCFHKQKTTSSFLDFVKVSIAMNLEEVGITKRHRRRNKINLTVFFRFFFRTSFVVETLFRE
ncbi:unnamed protein product [Brassica rapa subsp. narinosa]